MRKQRGRMSRERNRCQRLCLRHFDKSSSRADSRKMRAAGRKAERFEGWGDLEWRRRGTKAAPLTPERGIHSAERGSEPVMTLGRSTEGFVSAGFPIEGI